MEGSKRPASLSDSSSATGAAAPAAVRQRTTQQTARVTELRELHHGVAGEAPYLRSTLQNSIDDTYTLLHKLTIKFKKQRLGGVTWDAEVQSEIPDKPTTIKVLRRKKR